MVQYDRNKIWLHTKSQKLRNEWFDLFDELLALKEKRSKEEAEHTVCQKGLFWIGNYFTSFEEQLKWVKSGIEFYKHIGNKQINKITLK